MWVKYLDRDFKHSARVCVCAYVRVRIRMRTYTYTLTPALARESKCPALIQTSMYLMSVWRVGHFDYLLAWCERAH